MRVRLFLYDTYSCIFCLGSSVSVWLLYTVTAVAAATAVTQRHPAHCTHTQGGCDNPSSSQIGASFSAAIDHQNRDSKCTENR